MSRPRSDIQQRIQHAAREQFLLHGVDGASLRAIAAEAGTNIGMVYYYFPAKDDLFVATVEEVYKKLLEDLAALLGETGLLRKKLERLYTRIWTLSADEYATIRLVMREAMVSADRVRRLSPLFAHGHVPMLLGALMQGASDGELREELPPIALLVSTMALGLMPMLAWRVAGERVVPDFPLPGADELGRLFSSVLLGGIGAKSAKRAKSGAAIKRPARKKPARVRR